MLVPKVIWQEVDRLLVLLRALLELLQLPLNCIVGVRVPTVKPGQSSLPLLVKLIECLRPVDVLILDPVPVVPVLQQEDVSRFIIRQTNAVLIDTDGLALASQPVSEEVSYLFIIY